jgi:hypothetical protein
MKLAPKLLLVMLALVGLVVGMTSYVFPSNVTTLSRWCCAVLTDSLPTLAAAQWKDGGLDDLRGAATVQDEFNAFHLGANAYIPWLLNRGPLRARKGRAMTRSMMARASRPAHPNCEGA